MAPRAPILTALRSLAASGQLELLLLLLPLLLQVCGATMYTCVIYGNGVPSSTMSRIDVDASSLLHKLKDYEGAGYVAVAAGASARRGLSPGAALEAGEDAMTMEEEVDKSQNGEEEPPQHRELFDCPNSCSNSGSNYCRALGCAYCGTCNRERDLRFSLRRGLASANSVEVSMNRELAGYCQGISGCSLWAKIFVVHADGSLTPAP